MNEINNDIKYKSFAWAQTPVILDSLFREYDLRNPVKPLSKGGKVVPASVNEDGFRVLGAAYGTYVQKFLNQKKIVVGNDYRYYSRGLSFAFITGVLSTGVDVVDVGTHVTPVVYYAQHEFNLPGAAMITASHNDNGWTGLKLGKGLSSTLEPEDIKVFKEMVFKGDFIKGTGSYEKVTGMEDKYIEDIKKSVESYLGKKRLKIVISGTNGIGGLYFEKIFKALGHETIPFANDEDWDFPNFNPNPENIKFLHAIGDEVRKHNADLGVGIDGDGDRLGVVDNNGKEVFADRVGLFIARFLTEDAEEKGKPIIIDVKSTNAYNMDPVLKEHGTKIIFCKTGHSYVKAAVRDNDGLAGFEKSGHTFLKGKYGRGYDDATLSAAWLTTILSRSDKPFSEHIEDQPHSFQTPTMEPPTNDDVAKYEIMDKVIAHFKELHSNGTPFAGQKIKELITVNGVRFILESGAWGLIRASSNLPNLVVVCESFDKKKEIYDIFGEIKSYLTGNFDIGKFDQELPPYDGEP